MTGHQMVRVTISLNLRNNNLKTTVLQKTSWKRMNLSQPSFCGLRFDAILRSMLPSKKSVKKAGG